MECIEIPAATIMATSAMTLFSYLVSESFKKLYKEPVLLEFLLSSFRIDFSNRQKEVASWLIHYAIGLVFVISYYFPLWIAPNLYEITIKSGAVFGCITGALGIAGWQVMFKLSPAHPPVNVAEYYLQLFIAHVIFGIVTAAIHLLFAG